jgi:predicted nucleic acid-binding protein
VEAPGSRGLFSVLTWRTARDFRRKKSHVCRRARAKEEASKSRVNIRLITLDTGALVAMERRKQRGLALLDLAKHRLARLLVPVPVVVEWWRSRTDVRERILEAVSVEALSLADARLAGEALAKIRVRPTAKSFAIDAIVVAYAASHGGIVFTSDVQDLARIAHAYFPSVRVLGVGEGVDFD